MGDDSPVTALWGVGPLILAVLAVIYFLIAIFRSSYAEVNPVAAARILASRGLGPREGEAPSEASPIMRTTFDLLHHFVLIAAAAVCFAWIGGEGMTRPFLAGGLSVTAAMIAMQIAGRAIALANPERALSASLVLIAIVYHAVRPFAAPGIWAIRRMRRIGRERRLAEGEDEATDEQIEAFIDAGRKEGILEADEGNLIRQVVEFHDSVVREVMTPRTEVVSLPAGTTVAQAWDLFARERHSRVPVYRDQIDNVEGILTLKDLVAHRGRITDEAKIDSLLRPAYFVPETKQVSDLLKEFQARRIQLAIVVDEYGGTAGVVTIEDLLEQLVGDIQEEHEREETPVVAEGEGSFLALGTATLDDLRASLGVELSAEGFETVSGLIYSVLGRIPAEGESVEVGGLKLDVVKADTRRIERVRVRRLVETPAP
ncbi:MAG TPA: hemolysin family protein [Candidatus Polarisedimenticolia bacterium]|jgi:CBS domain containing-hemolysin-like protein